MRTRKRIVVALFVTTLGIAGAANVAMAGWWVTGSTVAPGHAADAHLQVTGGEVHDLYPGGRSPATLEVRNTNNFPVQFRNFWITQVNVTGSPANMGCPSDVLSIGDWGPSTPLLLPQQTYTFEVGVVMDPDAPQECLGAEFEITWWAEGGVGTLPTP